MRNDDFDQFTAMLDAACELLSRGSYKPNAMSAALWFRALGAYDLAAVQQALDAHVRDPKRGRFVPTPADLIAHIEGATLHDGRPDADEAWAIALGARTEDATVVWTPEIRSAFDTARSVLKLGDEVGARLAFRNAYDRCVAAARAAKQPTQWLVSIGFDPEKRRVAVALAVAAGRLPSDEMLLLPAPTPSPESLIAKAPAHLRERLQALRDKLAARPPLMQLNADTSERDRLTDLKERTARRVADYVGQDERS